MPAKLLTKELTRRLVRNGKDKPDWHFVRPVAKLFTPWAGATWLLTEIDPEDPERAFGLCDLGLGFPELGYVALAEIAALRGPGGLTVERDRTFAADRSLKAYCEAAERRGRICA